MAARGYAASAKFRFSALQAKRGPTIHFFLTALDKAPPSRFDNEVRGTDETSSQDRESTSNWSCSYTISRRATRSESSPNDNSRTKRTCSSDASGVWSD